MGLTPFDVSNLNQAMAGVGNAFAERRREAMQQQQLDIDQDMRERMLDAEMSRLQLEKNRGDLMSGEVANRQQALQQQQSQQDMQDKQSMLRTAIMLNAGGQLTDDGRQKLNTWLSQDPHFGATGLQLQAPPTKPPAQLGQNSVAAGLQFASSMRAKAAATPDTDPLKQEYLKYADLAENSLNPGAYETHTENVLDPATGKVVGTRSWKVPRTQPGGSGIGADFAKWLQQRSADSSALPGATPAAPAGSDLLTPPPEQ